MTTKAFRRIYHECTFVEDEALRAVALCRMLAPEWQVDIRRVSNSRIPTAYEIQYWVGSGSWTSIWFDFKHNRPAPRFLFHLKVWRDLQKETTDASSSLCPPPAQRA